MNKPYSVFTSEVVILLPIEEALQTEYIVMRLDLGMYEPTLECHVTGDIAVAPWRRGSLIFDFRTDRTCFPELEGKKYQSEASGLKFGKALRQ